MGTKRSPVGLRDVDGKRFPDHSTALRPEHRGAGEVDLRDAARRIERAVSNGGEVVQIGVTSAGLFELLLGLAQLLILGFELRLVNFEIVNEVISLVEQPFDLLDA